MALAFEIDLIAGIGQRSRQSGPLANLTEGGEGQAGYKQTKEHIEKRVQSKAVSFASMTDAERRLHKEISSANISKGKLGKPMSAIGKANMKGNKKPPRTPEHCAKLSAAAKLRHARRRAAGIKNRKPTGQALANIQAASKRRWTNYS